MSKFFEEPEPMTPPDGVTIPVLEYARTPNLIFDGNINCMVKVVSGNRIEHTLLSVDEARVALNPKPKLSSMFVRTAIRNALYRVYGSNIEDISKVFNRIEEEGLDLFDATKLLEDTIDKIHNDSIMKIVPIIRQ